MERVKEGYLPWKRPAPMAFSKGKLACYTLVCQQPADFLMSVLKRGLSQSTLPGLVKRVRFAAR